MLLLQKCIFRMTQIILDQLDSVMFFYVLLLGSIGVTNVPPFQDSFLFPLIYHLVNVSSIIPWAPRLWR